MSIPGHSILPVVEADLPTLTEFLQASKLQLAINRFLFKDWPAVSAQRANSRAAVESGLRDPQTNSLKVVNDSSGIIVAHLFLTRHSSSNSETRSTSSSGKAAEKESQSQVQVPQSMVPAVLETVRDAMRELKPEFDGDYIELTHIYVEPSSRNQGIGTQLVQVCRDRARADGLPLTICAEPNHHDFFLKRGFRDTKHVDIDLRHWAPEHNGYGIFRVSRMDM
ncbi:hypothetical protein F5B20DRAFT_544572 [Whalleya microplaca]|nr:hypothetical protein F5B20DRAFT_544572 [Whalleya microplaca]